MTCFLMCMIATSCTSTRAATTARAVSSSSSDGHQHTKALGWVCCMHTSRGSVKSYKVIAREACMLLPCDLTSQDQTVSIDGTTRLQLHLRSTSLPSLAPKALSHLSVPLWPENTGVHGPHVFHDGPEVHLGEHLRLYVNAWRHLHQLNALTRP